MAGNFKGLNRRAAADKVLRNKAFSMAKSPKYDAYQRGLVSMVYKFFDKKYSRGTVKNENVFNKGLAAELHKPVTKKIKKIKTQPPFLDNIWDADLADIQLISKFDNGFRFLLSVINIQSNIHGLFLYKIEKELQLLMFFKKFEINQNANQTKYVNFTIDQ